jgi:hypothetical protein
VINSLRILSVASVVCLSLLAIACGGGGGGSSIQQAPQARPATPAPTAAPRSCSANASLAAALEAFRRPVVPKRVGPGPASRACPIGGPGRVHCTAWLRTDVVAQSTPFGYGPADLQSAYCLAAASAAGGTGQTVAVVDAYDDPKAQSDLGIYRSTFALAPCTAANGCFSKVNEFGKPSPLPTTDPSGGWEAEESLDLDMVSAVCPNCKILFVEAVSDNNTDLYTAEDTAARLGANEISNSWNGSEYASEVNGEVYFNHPGVMITVASGDNAYNNPNEGYPATSRYVTAVGGTTLAPTGSSWQETVWPDTGSRCSSYISQPSWQQNLGSSDTSKCRMRIDNDVAAVADPNTGVATFDSFGGSKGCSAWCISGGTSVATPIIAAVYALAGNGASLTYGSYSYSHAGSLFDVTSGSNGGCGNYLCNAEAGYDAPTGNGTPNGIGAF